MGHAARPGTWLDTEDGDADQDIHERLGLAFEGRELKLIVSGSRKCKPSIEIRSRTCLPVMAAIALLMTLAIPFEFPQHSSAQSSATFTIQGMVVDEVGSPVGDATVRLEQQGVVDAKEMTTGADGAFAFSALVAGSYAIGAQKAGKRASTNAVLAQGQREQWQLRLVLENTRASHPGSAAASSGNAAMEFTDQPSFTIAGVTDWTAAGGHGSDTVLRTSEALARETATLKPHGAGQGAANQDGEAGGSDASESNLRAAVVASPASAEANRSLGQFFLRAGKYPEAIRWLQAAYSIEPRDRRNEFDLAIAFEKAGNFQQAREHTQELLAQGQSAELHALAGEVDEKLGDPLAAVHEFEQAARMDPSEQNYFEWGSELLLHRAIWQAVGVFQQGAKAYPQSERMLAALGAAQFAGARYDQAALRFCEASDLNPSDPDPYIFLGKIEMAAPNRLDCVEQKLARFLAQQPGNARANYYYAIALWKEQGQNTGKKAFVQVEAFLTKAIAIDAKCGDAYLQLGILRASQGDYEKAIDFYKKAISADPELGDAHYRLGMAYDRIGERDKARTEFQLHDEIKNAQAAAVEQERREVKQFLVVVPGQPTYPLVQ